MPERVTVVLRPVPVFANWRSEAPGVDPSASWYCDTPTPESQENVAAGSVRIVPLPGFTILAADVVRTVSITAVVLRVPPL